MKIDGFDFLNGRVKPHSSNTPCINSDLTVVAWSRERGLHMIGRGTSLDAARAIARLHSGQDDYIHFDSPITVNMEVGARTAVALS